MPIKKSIRDIEISKNNTNNLKNEVNDANIELNKDLNNDFVDNVFLNKINIDGVKKTRVKKIKKVEDNIVNDFNNVNDIEENKIEEVKIIQEEHRIEEVKNIQKENIIKNKYKKTIKILSQIKPIYLIAFGIIFIGLIVLFFIPANKAKDPIEQARKESDFVKKHFSKHIVLPENEQIDIRKITNKIEDPFFKNAEIGDYLIIFYKNRIAYIYSVDKNIIINAGVVFIDPKTATTTSATKTQ